MSVARKIMICAAPLALVALGGCAQTFNAKVNRFAAIAPPVQGETFVVQPINPKLQGGLEFQSYAQLVAQRLESFGYRQATDPRSANLVVSLDYWVDNGRERVTTTPGFGAGWGPWGRFGGWGGWGWGGGWGPGFYDPFWGPGFGGGWGPDVRSYTIYDSQLRMEIARTGDGQRVFEGTARATSRNDDLPWLVPNLVQAMFTDFPGNNGQTVTVKVPLPPRR